MVGCKPQNPQGFCVVSWATLKPIPFLPDTSLMWRPSGITDGWGPWFTRIWLVNSLRRVPIFSCQDDSGEQIGYSVTRGLPIKTINMGDITINGVIYHTTAKHSLPLWVRLQYGRPYIYHSNHIEYIQCTDIEYWRHPWVKACCTERWFTPLYLWRLNYNSKVDT